MDIKITNVRGGGYLFHYAHFMLDCVYPEILCKTYENSIVYRKYTIEQTLGNFKDLWEEIFESKSLEIPEKEFNKKNIKHLHISNQPINSQNIEIFRSYFFNKYPIDINGYPKILLIERKNGVKVLSDQNLIKQISSNTLITNGKTRRDIKDIDKLKNFLIENYRDSFQCIELEGMSIKKQINYFYNANFIIMSHGAAMSNTLFCKPDTKILEVGYNKCKIFDKISSKLALNHIKCPNEYSEIQNCILKNKIQ